MLYIEIGTMHISASVDVQIGKSGDVWNDSC